MAGAASRRMDSGACQGGEVSQLVLEMWDTKMKLKEDGWKINHKTTSHISHVPGCD